MGFFKSVTKSIGNVVAKPVHAVGALAKGDTKQAWKDIKNSASGGMLEVGKRELGISTDQMLGIEAATAATAGLAGGAAGAAGGSSAAGAASTQLGLTGAAVPASAAAGGVAGTTAALSGGAAGLTAGILSGSGQTLANLLGAGASAATNYAGAKYAADKSAQSAEQINERQIAWERERATNAHQWEIQDLKNAGLNPVLSAGGQGAATGGISAVQPDTSGYQAAGGALRGFFELLNNNRLANAQADLINAQTTEQIMKNPYVSKQEKAKLANTVTGTKLNNANSAEALSRMNVNAAQAAEIYSRIPINKELVNKTHNESWTPLHQQQLYDAQRAYYEGTKQGQAGLIYEGRHKYIKTKK